MTMSTKSIIISLGAFGGAIVGIWQAVALATPLLKSDPPPFGGKAELEQIAQAQQTLQQSAQSLNQSVEITRMELLEMELDRAKDDLRLNPKSSSAQNQVCGFIDQIDTIRIKMRLPPIQPCFNGGMHP